MLQRGSSHCRVGLLESNHLAFLQNLNLLFHPLAQISLLLPDIGLQGQSNVHVGLGKDLLAGHGSLRALDALGVWIDHVLANELEVLMALVVAGHDSELDVGDAGSLLLLNSHFIDLIFKFQ